MSARTRAGLALIGACLALAVGLLGYLSTLEPWSPIPPDVDPSGWWECHGDAIDTLPTPPPCLTGATPSPQHDTEGETP